MEKAHHNLIYGNLKTAIENYTALLDEQPANGQLYIFRAIAYMEIANYDLALKDLEKVNEMRKDIFQVHYRMGMIYFNKQQFAQALTSLKTAEGLAKEEYEKAALVPWIQKCLREQGNMSAVALNATATIPSGKPSASPVPASTEEVKQVVAENNQKKIEYDWYQSTTFVFMTLKIKGINKEKLNITFGSHEVGVALKLEEGKTFEQAFSLNAEIIPEQCSFNVFETKVELKLKKKEDGYQWTSLEKTDLKTPDRPSYPTSAKKKVDWDKLDKEIVRDTAKEKPEGDEAMNSLFKAIYE